MALVPVPDTRAEDSSLFLCANFQSSLRRRVESSSSLGGSRRQLAPRQKHADPLFLRSSDFNYLYSYGDGDDTESSGVLTHRLKIATRDMVWSPVVARKNETQTHCKCMFQNVPSKSHLSERESVYCTLIVTFHFSAV